jgi:hypothetical protein
MDYATAAFNFWRFHTQLHGDMVVIICQDCAFLAPRAVPPAAADSTFVLLCCGF